MDEARRVAGAVMLSLIAAGDGSGPPAAGASMSDHLGRLAGSVRDRTLDVVGPDEIVERVDVNAVIDRVDVNRLLDRVDVARLVDRVDPDRLLARVDVNAVMDRVDVERVVQRAGIPESSPRAPGALRSLRRMCSVDSCWPSTS